MALNLDAALRVIAKVQGVNEFKQLTDTLETIGAASKESRTGLQQLSAESGRLTQEAAKATGSVRAEAAALQELQTRTRAGAAEMGRMASEARGLGASVNELRGKSAGAMDGLAASAGKGAKGLRELGQAQAAAAQGIQQLQGTASAGAAGLGRLAAEAKGLGAGVSDLRGKTAGVLDGLTESASRGAKSIRDLHIGLQPTDEALARLRDEVLALGNASKQSERSLEQQASALKNLRSQAQINGELYQQLTGDIQRLTNASKGMAESALFGVEGLRKLGAASQTSAQSVELQIKSLTRLQSTLVKGSEGYRAIGKEIDTLKAKAASLDLSKGLNIPGAVMGGVGRSAASGIAGAISGIVDLRRQLARSNPGRVVLAGEGLAAAGLTGAAGAGVASGLGGLAAGASAAASSMDAIAAKAQALPGLLKPLGSLLSEPAAGAASSIAQWGASLGAAQAKLQALAAPFEAIGTAVSAIGPEAAAAAGAASLAIASVYQVLSRQADKAQKDAEESFKGISEEAQRALEQLTRLYDRMPSARLQAQQDLRSRNLARLGEVAPDSVDARRASNAVAAAEREIAKIQTEQNALLDQARQRQNAQTEAIKQQVAAARERLEVQRRLTAEAAAERAQYAADRAVAGSIRRNQERQDRSQQRAAKEQAEENALLEQARQRELAHTEAINQQITAARQRLEVQRQITAEVKASQAQYAADRAVAGSIRRAQERQEREQQRLARAAERQQADLARRAAEAFAPSVTLALPAAGQTAFRGTVNAQGLGGGARASLAGVEIAGTRDAIGAPMPGYSGAAKAALNQQAEATDKAREALSRLWIEVDKAKAAGNGSVQSLQRQRAAWEALRVAVNPAAPAYEKARAKVQALDEQLKRLSVTQEKANRRGMGREAVGGALGALATGGGLQSAVGSLAGSLAFSGGAAGLVAGGAITAAAGAGALAVRVGVDAETARVRLKALTEQFGEYNQAQAAATRISQTLRVSQTEAEDSFSKLYAALRPTGVTLKEVEDAYVGFAAAARASGATATETSAAMLQLKQALGSGVLQGDELRSIREQAPAVGQAVAKEMGVTVGELKKLGSEGKITTDIVLRALARLKEEKLDDLNAQFNTSEQALKDLQIATEDVGRAIARIFGPTALAILRTFTSGLKDVALVLKSMSGDQGAQAIMEDRVKARDQAAAEAGKRFGLFDLGGKEAYFQRRQEELFRQFQRDRANAAAPDAPTAEQRAQRDQAARERAQAAARQAREEAQKRLEDELKIRQDAEKRLADAAQQRQEQIAEFRAETIRRAADLERQLGDQRRDIEREIAASRLAAARAQQDLDLNLEVQQRRAAGLSVDRLEEARATRELFRQFEDQIQQGRQTALDRQLALQRQMEQFKIETAQGMGKIQEAYAKAVSAILQDAGEKLAAKMQEGAQNAASILSSATPGGAGGTPQDVYEQPGVGWFDRNTGAFLGRQRPGSSGVIARTGNTGDSTGPHLDARWADKRPITVADVARYILLNGQPPGSGAFPPSSGYGPRRLFGRTFHYGQDIEAPVGTGITLRNGATLLRDLGFTGDGGYAVEIMTPEGPMRLLHLQKGTAAKPGPATSYPAPPVLPPPPGASAAAAAGPSLGSAAVSEANKRLEEAATETAKRQQEAEVAARRSSFAALLSGLDQRTSGATSELDGQARSAREKLEDEVRYEALLKDGITPELARQRIEMDRIASREREKLEGVKDELERKIESGKFNTEETKALQGQLEIINARIAAQPAILAGLENELYVTEKIKKARRDAEGRDVGKGIKDGAKAYLEEVGTLAEGVANITTDVLKGLEDQLVNFVTTGKANFKELAASILKDMARIAIQQMVLKPILGAFGVVPNAAGNIYGPGGLVPFANGGIVNSPTLFQFAGGTGLMGEAGPEAIVPLRRGKDGKLGIVASGGGGGNVSVSVSVDATGSSVQGEAGQGQQLGRAIAAAVQNELIRQKRPGGLLAV